MERLLLRPARRLQRARPVSSASFGWTCASCRHHARRYSTESSSLPGARPDEKKPYYVTTPIFYVNAAPHVGHLYSMCVADALKRWHALTGRKALLLTGTDEHGMKIQRAAAANDVPPKEWCDMQAQQFRELAQRANIANDFFIRTTDEDHKEAVRHFWCLLQHSGHVYEAKHEGWYSVSDETFYTESQLVRQQDPITGRVYPASVETGSEVEWMEEKTYHFRLTAMKDQLLEFYKQNPDWITPDFRMREVVDWVTNKLEDLSISRPTSRLEWGIRVPDDENHTIYVWVDALVNYLTKAGFPNWTPGKENEGGWPADMHVIGKDILRFHGVYWPAMLLAVGIPPPKRMLSHGHWTMGGQKMSKSLGNVVSPFHAIDRWGADTMRYFMLLDGGIGHDADYENKYIQERYNKNLKDSIGNLLTRVTRSKKWNVRESVQAGFSFTAALNRGEVDTSTPGARRLKASRQQIEDCHAIMMAHMTEGNSRKTLRELRDYVTRANFDISEMAPWALAKQLGSTTNEKDTKMLTEGLCLAIFDIAERLRHLGIWLQPFMPEKAAHLLDVMGVDESKRTFEYIGFAKDSTYGVPLRDPGSTAHDAMFPTLEVPDVGQVREWGLQATERKIMK